MSRQHLHGGMGTRTAERDKRPAYARQALATSNMNRNSSSRKEGP